MSITVKTFGQKCFVLNKKKTNLFLKRKSQFVKAESFEGMVATACGVLRSDITWVDNQICCVWYVVPTQKPSWNRNVLLKFLDPLQMLINKYFVFSISNSIWVSKKAIRCNRLVMMMITLIWTMLSSREALLPTSRIKPLIAFYDTHRWKGGDGILLCRHHTAAGGAHGLI